MILNLGGSISVESSDIVAIIDLTRPHGSLTGSLLREAKRQNRILAGQGVTARSAILCAGGRKPGGITENARLYLSQVSAVKLARRAENHRARLVQAEHAELEIE